MKLQVTRIARGAAIGTAVWGLAACAGTPVAADKIAVAQASVQRAEQSGAPELAPVELATAKDKLNRAQQAAANRDGASANMLADQSNVDAQLAEATANQQRAHKAAMEFDASMQALRQEAMRATQPAPAQPMPVQSQPTQ